MVQVVKLEAQHLEYLLEQESMKSMRPFVRSDYLQALERSNDCFTVFSETGKILACGGIAEYWKDRGEVWVVFNENCKREFLAIHNAVKRFLNSCVQKRIEAAVAVNFERGHRWIKMLGFELEAPKLRSYLQDGTDCALYARVR